MIGSFTTLFSDKCLATYPIALGGTGELISRQRFRVDVSTLCLQLMTMSEKRWALCFKDSYWFAVSLFASGFADKEIIVPGNITSKNAILVIKDHYDAVLSDLELSIDCPRLRPEIGSALGPFPECSLLKMKITLFTSGSTTSATAIRKTFKEFDAEITVLSQLFGNFYAGNEVFATVSHQHIYGLLFRILLPLATGATFSAKMLEYPDQVSRASARNRILVSSPALLKRLETDKIEHGYCKVISSGGPLPFPAAQKCKELFGDFPIEVYGSSETGGIGWRKQNTRDEPWHTFPGIELRCIFEDRLEIRSPFIAKDDWYVTNDRVALVSDTMFELIGRVDRVVKVSEKRISLDDVEQCLQQLTEINAAVIVPLEKSGRLELGAVVKLSCEGRDILNQIGKHAFINMIRRSVAAYIEPVGVPRRFRFVEDIPVNSQGKSVMSVLEGLFT